MSRKATLGVVALTAAAVVGVVLALIIALAPETLVRTKTRTVVEREVIERRLPPHTVTVPAPVPDDAGAAQPSPDEQRTPRLGVEVMDLSSACRQGLLAACNSRRGLMVARVERGGPAAEAGIRRGDVIVRVDGVAVVNAAVLLDVLDGAGSGAAVDVELRRFQEEDGASVLGPVTVTVELPA